MGDFLDGDCGGPSASVSLASHFTRDKAFKDEGLHAPGSQAISSQQLVNEFLDETLSEVCNPFHMGALLSQMQNIEQNPSATHSESYQWTQEFSQNVPSPHLQSTQMQDNDFGPTTWVTDFKLNPSPFSLTDERDSMLDQTDAFRNAASEFIQMADQQNDVKILNSQFADFMKKVATGEVTTPEMVRRGPFSELEQHNTDSETAQQWTNQFTTENGGAERSENWQSEFNGTEKDFWDKMASEWEQISTRENIPWLTEFYDYTNINKDYNFSTDNPMEDMVNALDEGQKRLQKGDLPGAVLCFEAAVKQQPDNPTAWQLLGTTQAENEQDVQAIAALKKCISLDLNNLVALMALAVSYTNENYQNQACKALKEWIRVNPNYSDLARGMPPQDDRIVSSLMSKEHYDEVKSLFLEAARRNPQESIDADVQTGLSVLFNLSSEPDLAADCCTAALSVRPNDWRLWNRLGATLANGGRSEEAVDAYRNALELSPGFIRARYNLGITCIHLRAYREAAEHLLTALNQQVSAVGLQGEPSAMSDTIWTTLRLVISLLERPDLMPEVNNRDLSKLNEAFNIN